MPVVPSKFTKGSVRLSTTFDKSDEWTRVTKIETYQVRDELRFENPVTSDNFYIGTANDGRPA